MIAVSEPLSADAQAHAQLAASRARLLAAADQERRRLARDLYDGAQQRLVHTVITLKLAQAELQDHHSRVAQLVKEALSHAEAATRISASLPTASCRASSPTAACRRPPERWPHG